MVIIRLAHLKSQEELLGFNLTMTIKYFFLPKECPGLSSKVISSLITEEITKITRPVLVKYPGEKFQTLDFELDDI